MKRHGTALFNLLLLALGASCAGKDSLDVTVRVVDHDELPIEGATVGVGFRSLGAADMSDSGFTNGNGIYVARGQSNYEFVARVSKDGYYPSHVGRRSVERQIDSGDWEVTNQENTVTLREILSPIPMYAKRATIIVPEKGQAFGFDLEIGDWVAPQGEGKVADILISADGYFNSSSDTKSILRISFPNREDGFISNPAVAEESEFQSPYQAPLFGYRPTIEGEQGTFVDETGRVVQIEELATNEVIVFRLRTEMDDNGQIKKAQYGKIYDGFTFGGAASPEGYFLKFTYYLNPTVNDRNLEYAVGESLIDGLKDSEQPRKP